MVPAGTLEAESRRAMTRELCGIVGLGPAKARRFYDAGLTSLAALQEATIDELAAIDGIGMGLATHLKANLPRHLPSAEPRTEATVGTFHDDATPASMVGGAPRAGSPSVRPPPSAHGPNRPSATLQPSPHLTALTQLGIDPILAQRLYDAGITTPGDLRDCDPTQLQGIDGMTPSRAQQLQRKAGRPAPDHASPAFPRPGALAGRLRSLLGSALGPAGPSPTHSTEHHHPSPAPSTKAAPPVSVVPQPPFKESQEELLKGAAPAPTSPPASTGRGDAQPTPPSAAVTDQALESLLDEVEQTQRPTK